MGLSDEDDRASGALFFGTRSRCGIERGAAQ
jgi:hypothetical protein